MKKTLEFSEYLKKLCGCYTGKAVGGTLGMPLEGFIGTKEITYYDPVPTQMIENDDIDLQIVWLEAIKDCGLPINRYSLAKGWLEHMRGLPDEYGVVIRNLKCGLFPPLSGSYDNKFDSGMGSVIRTEIWAALAPCDPALAVKLSLEDACCDHFGGGIDATAFLCAMESAAYGESDIRRLIECGLSFINQNGRVYQLLTDTIRMYDAKMTPTEIRAELLAKYFVQNWTDTAINLSFLLIGLLDCDKYTDICEKVSHALCTTVGLGHDADCTGASLGSLLGILYPDGFEERWTAPLGDSLVLSSCITAMHEASTVTGFCGEIASLSRDIISYYHSDTVIENRPNSDAPSLPHISRNDDCISLMSQASNVASSYNGQESLISTNPVTIRLMYPDDVALEPSQSAEFSADIYWDSKALPELSLNLRASSGWSVAPASFTLKDGIGKIRFTVTAPPMRSRRVSKNSLFFDFKSHDLSYQVSAGLIETYPLLHKSMLWESDECPDISLFDGADTIHMKRHFTDVPAGGQLYMFDVRSPYLVSEAIMLAQASRPVKVWRDGELILSHDGTETCPAFHRTENIARLAFGGIYTRFVIYVSPGRAEGEHYTPYNAYARVENCPTPYEQRVLYDKTLPLYEDGELFVGFANRACYEWLNELEWKIPGSR